MTWREVTGNEALGNFDCDSSSTAACLHIKVARRTVASRSPARDQPINSASDATALLHPSLTHTKYLPQQSPNPSGPRKVP
jgi:hypothetical protein